MSEEIVNVQMTQKQRSALALLAKREKEIRAEGERVKAESAAIEQAKKVLALAKENPLEFLQHQGVSYDSLTEQVKRGQTPDPVAPVRDELARLREQMEEQRNFLEQQQLQAARDEEAKTLRTYLSSGEAYPLIRAMGFEDAVFDHLQAHYNDTGQELSHDEAAKQVEAQLAAVVGKLETAGYVSRAQQRSNEPAPTESHDTLTNDLGTETASVASPDGPVGWTTDSDEAAMLAAAEMIRFVDTSQGE